MPRETIRVQGYREFLRACARAEKQSRTEVRSALKEVGDIVRVEWSARFARVDARSAAGYRTRVRQRGVFVEQSLRKTTGLHPEYGALQERYGLRVLTDKEPDVERGLEKAIDKIADDFENH